MRVHVQALQLIAPHGQGCKEHLLREAIAGSRPAVIARDGGEVVKDLVHPAVLGIQDVLHMLFGFRCRPCIDPAREFDEDVKCLLIAGLGFHVEQPGHDFVQGVKRNPDLLAAVEAIEEFGGEGADVAIVVELLLARGDSCHKLIGLGFDGCVARGCVEKRACRQIMPHKMSTHFAGWIFPSAERLGGRGQSGSDAEVVQQAVVRQAQHVGAIPVARLLERSGFECDIA